MINHLNPAKSKTKRSLESTNRRQIKLSQSIDHQTRSPKYCEEHRHMVSLGRQSSEDRKGLKDTIFRMAMEITDLKTFNEKLQSQLKQAQNMEEYYLKQLQQRKQHISKLQDIVTLSQNSLNIPIDNGLKSQLELEQSSLQVSNLKPVLGDHPSRLQALKKKFQNKQNNWQHRRLRSQMRK